MICICIYHSLIYTSSIGISDISDNVSKIDGDDDVTDTIIVVTGPMGTTSTSCNGPYKLQILIQALFMGWWDNTPWQGIIGSVNSMKIHIQQETGGSANDQSDISHSCESLFQSQLTNRTAMLFHDMLS